MSKFLTDIKKEDLELITELAKVFFTEEEVCTFLKLPWQQFKIAVSDKTHKINEAYYSGWYQAEFEMRKIIMRSAIAGSTPAQNTILDIHKKSFSNRLRP